MLQSTVIGYIGGDAECKNVNGNEFIAFRVANTEKFTDQAGQVHESTTWVDCIMNGKPKVFEFLKKGTLVFCSGNTSLRVYSSAKDRCMKAGLTINVRSIELLGGKADEVPSVLYKKDTGEEVKVRKFYHSAECVAEKDDAPDTVLVSKSGKEFLASAKGWLSVPQNTSDNAANS